MFEYVQIARTQGRPLSEHSWLVPVGALVPSAPVSLRAVEVEICDCGTYYSAFGVRHPSAGEGECAVAEIEAWLASPGSCQSAAGILLLAIPHGHEARDLLDSRWAGRDSQPAARGSLGGDWLAEQ